VRDIPQSVHRSRGTAAAKRVGVMPRQTALRAISQSVIGRGPPQTALMHN
jgi:hypothetical protein